MLTAALATYTKIPARASGRSKARCPLLHSSRAATNSTVDGIHWKSLSTSYHAGNPPDPVTNDPGLAPATIRNPARPPAATSPLVEDYTVPISSLGHMFMMNKITVLTTIGTLIGV